MEVIIELSCHVIIYKHYVVRPVNDAMLKYKTVTESFSSRPCVYHIGNWLW